MLLVTIVNQFGRVVAQEPEDRSVVLKVLSSSPTLSRVFSLSNINYLVVRKIIEVWYIMILLKLRYLKLNKFGVPIIL